uniref:Uncharacterized protein n=1 Tax=Manihot esculenta TaxID=3983 RepID=A0A2C9WNP2_MANES
MMPKILCLPLFYKCVGNLLKMDNSCNLASLSAKCLK